MITSKQTWRASRNDTKTYITKFKIYIVMSTFINQKYSHIFSIYEHVNVKYLHVGDQKHDATDCQEGESWEEQVGQS